MKHQLKIILGNLKKSAFTSFLNLIGLTSAFAAFILIMLYVWNEYHFDGFQKNAGEIYRLEARSPEGGKTNVFMLGPTGQTLKGEFPEILGTTTYMPWGKWGEQPFSYNNTAGQQDSYEDYAYADENLTDIFSFEFIYGNNPKPLEKPETNGANNHFRTTTLPDNKIATRIMPMPMKTSPIYSALNSFMETIPNRLKNPKRLSLPNRLHKKHGVILIQRAKS